MRQIMHLRIAFWMAALSLHWPRSRASDTCWFPDHTTPTTDIPCNSDGGFSSCCQEDAFCLDNGLCMSGGLISRGSCTDKTWNSPECPQFCVGDQYDDTGVALQPCNDGANTWTCGTSNSNCINNASVFVINGGNNIILRASQVAALQTGSSTAMTFAPTTVFKADGEADDASGGGNAFAESNGSGTFTAGQMAGVGAGVGIPLLIALLAAILVILQQRKRLQRQEQAGQSIGLSGQMSATTYTPSPAGLPAYEGYQNSKPPGGYYQEGERPGHFREMEAQQIHEIDNNASRPELPASPR